ncbi:MAG: DUF3878 family protein [Clostridia bacterium]|nr:DUF3878 family protein [Clostridia bacterium]
MKETIILDEVLRNCIQELIDCAALELLRCLESNPNDMYIPYMMNDALEYYFILTDCTAIGELKTDFPLGTTVETVQFSNRNGLIIRRPDETILTLQYHECRSVRRLYQYHMIGHFWREGQEQWRQLVYIIGTMYDKLHYIGEEACNAEEKQLIPLITFAPFRYWSPIHEDLDDFYTDTEEGFCLMEALTAEAQDRAYLALLQQYRQKPDQKMTEFLAHALIEPGRKALYHVIWQKLYSASSCYPVRDYGIVLNTKIAAERKKAADVLYRKGFTGKYPCFRQGTVQVVAAEEHPYTVFGLEYDDFTFRIQFMVSHSCNPENVWNAGFFEGNGTVIHSLYALENMI